MKKCIIFCAADFDSLLQPIEKGDIVIAADGGLRHTQRLGLTPDIILGDFDSLGYIPEGANVFPVEKDDTDAVLAFRKGLSLGCDKFYFYGALEGKRLDHTIANCQMLHYISSWSVRGYLIGKDYILTAIRDETIRFPAGAKGILSLFCMGEDATGVTLKGLKYTMENGTLTSGFPLGVSNQFIGKEAAITVEKGCLLLIWNRENGLPEGSLC